jgi:hypothetical protein
MSLLLQSGGRAAAAAAVPRPRGAAPLSASSAAPPLLRRPRRAAAAPPPSALPEWFAKMVDFESWAPRSSRMWRLDQYSYERSTSSSDEEIEREAAIDGLQQRIAAMRRGGGGAGGAVADEEEDQEDETEATDEKQQQQDGAALASMPAGAPLTAAAIARAAGQDAAASDAGGAQEEDVEPLTAAEIRLLLIRKYDKQYDCAFVRRDMGPAVYVALNIYPNCLEQRSFRLTEAQYEEKLANVAARLHVLGQTKRVRTFLQAPAKSQKGLPRRPTMGTAVSIMLDLTPAQVEAYFSTPGF